jgi:DHA1 family inner membrane transport protein
MRKQMTPRKLRQGAAQMALNPSNTDVPQRAEATRSDAAAARRSTLALATIAAAAFVLGTAELVVVGVLDLVADDFEVSIATAGLLVTTYALGISIGGPVLAAMTLRLPRKDLMRYALCLYVAGNILAVSAGGFGSVLLARAVTGALHGVFIGAAFSVATAIVPKERMGRAIAAVFGGIAVSAAVGVPLGTLIGQTFGWQATFGCVIALGIVALGATGVLVPDVGTQGAAGTRAQARLALAPPVLAVLGVGFLLLGGQFAGLTYLANYLADVTGVSGAATTVFLLCFGIANAVGTMLGGAAADRDAAGTLVRANVILVVALAILYWTGATPGVTAIALGVWGLVGFGMVPSLQHRVVTLAGPGAQLAATLPASAVTAGIAAGSLAGGWVVSSGGAAPIGLAALVCAITLPVTLATSRFGVSRQEPASPDAPRPAADLAAQA